MEDTLNPPVKATAELNTEVLRAAAGLTALVRIDPSHPLYSGLALLLCDVGDYLCAAEEAEEAAKK